MFNVLFLIILCIYIIIFLNNLKKNVKFIRKIKIFLSQNTLFFIFKNKNKK